MQGGSKGGGLQRGSAFISIGRRLSHMEISYDNRRLGFVSLAFQRVAIRKSLERFLLLLLRHLWLQSGFWAACEPVGSSTVFVLAAHTKPLRGICCSRAL